VTVGDTVTWTQGTDEEAHTATADDDTFDTGVLSDEGDTGEFTFDEAGEFSYFCEIHPEMLGLVTVVE
jgi:plastocyanin